MNELAELVHLQEEEDDYRFRPVMCDVRSHALLSTQWTVRQVCVQALNQERSVFLAS